MGSVGDGRVGRRRFAGAVGAVGELLITFGLVLALFVGYSLWWTDVVAEGAAGKAGEQLRQGWAAQPPPGPPEPGRPLPEARSFTPGSGIGFLRVPALGRDFEVLIRMGTGPETLDAGAAGVYEEPYRAAMPWAASGNFALAAHRDGHGAKFHDLDRLGPGDAVVVETVDRWFVYRVAGTLEQTSKYDTGIVAPVPKGSPFTGPGRYITLTTCTPVYTSRYRMAVFGELVREEPVDARRSLPAELR
ncbi:class E sortase [Kitasatospora sp. NPDC048365]|uniref:class E sortase n=1 Tax=Kitasatospora sp. NPDC048365 TaxID=3364050 RepID=UPI003710A47A